MSASAPIYTAGWFLADGDTESDQVTSVYTAGWFLNSFRLPRLDPSLPQDEASNEQKIPGLLKRFHNVGTGSTLSAGTMGSSDGDSGEVVL